MYGKFFASTFTGSLFGAGPDVFAVWGYVIANTVDAAVELNPALVAAVLGTSEDRVNTAIAFLCAADPMSRTPDENGRRLVADGGMQYRVVNHDHYRAMRNEDDRRAYNRVAKQRERAKKSTGVNRRVNDMSAVSAQAEAEAEAEACTKSVSSEPHSGSEPLPPTPALLTFRTIGTGESTWTLTEAQIVAWRAAYPALDVLQECRKAHVWVEAQPSRRKTARGMLRFLVGWLNRASDGHRGSLQPSRSSRPAWAQGRGPE